MKISAQKGTEITADDIKSPMDNICKALGITQLVTPNTWNTLHDPKYLDVVSAFVIKPSLVRADITVDEINQAMRDHVAHNVIGIAENASKTATKKLDYVNCDAFANLFINYSVTDRLYLIAGLGVNLDLEGKGRSLRGRNSKKDKTNNSETSELLSDFYHTKFAITPQLGFGIQCGKHFAIELTGYDQITKIEYDCSEIYQTSVMNSIQRYLPGITTLLPNKKQSNWVNRFGVDLGVKFNITDRFFLKTGLFYTFPRNIFKKIQPLDLNLQSAGLSFSVGVIL